jgi:hypothetical protein
LISCTASNRSSPIIYLDISSPRLIVRSASAHT